jgi:two-component system phosphate regulon response regulator PhoB
MKSAIAELIAVNLRHNGFRPIWAMDSETAQRDLDAGLARSHFVGLDAAG